MQITNFIHDSFQEFYPYQSLVLFSNKCNLACKYCYNLKEIKKEAKYDAKEILDKHITPLHQAVTFLGGEPTLHEDLPDLLAYVKYSLNLKTKLYTNGLQPNMLEKCKNFLDEISIDFKCFNNMEILGKEINSKRYTESIKSCIKICKNIPIEIRTTIYNDMDNDELEMIKRFSEKHFKDYIVEHIFQKEFVIQQQYL